MTCTVGRLRAPGRAPGGSLAGLVCHALIGSLAPCGPRQFSDKRDPRAGRHTAEPRSHVPELGASPIKSVGSSSIARKTQATGQSAPRRWAFWLPWWTSMSGSPTGAQVAPDGTRAPLRPFLRRIRGERGRSGAGEVCGGGSHLVLDTTVRALRHLMVSAVKTVWAKARPKRCPRPGRRSDQAPPINDRASAGPTTRS